MVVRPFTMAARPVWVVSLLLAAACIAAAEQPEVLLYYKNEQEGVLDFDWCVAAFAHKGGRRGAAGRREQKLRELVHAKSDTLPRLALGNATGTMGRNQ